MIEKERKKMAEKGDIVQLTITDLGSEGQGIGRADGLAVFVKGAVPGDVVNAALVTVKKNYAIGQMREIIQSSPDRIDPPCALAGVCGGCAMQGIQYSTQLALKKKMVADKLVRLGGITDPVVRDTVGMAHPFAYRNKAQFAVSGGGIKRTADGRWGNERPCTVGFYQAKSHKVVDCEPCLIQAEPAIRLAKALETFMASDHITAYDEQTGKGLIRHLIVKTAFRTGEVMVILVINGKGVPNGDKLAYLMDDVINEIPPTENGVTYSLESVILNINKKKNGEMMGEQSFTVAGKSSILDGIGDLEFEISPQSFYQVNPVQTKVLYDQVVDYAALTGEETVIDLYCGVGTIGIYCASQAKRVIGIESVKAAVLDANRNAVINGIVNAEFVCGKVEDALPKLLAEGVKADVILLDPPRAGCNPALFDAIAEADPARIVYVSCDPATMARDVRLLTEKGYAFVEAQPVDMFPWTSSVEMVVRLERKA